MSVLVQQVKTNLKPAYSSSVINKSGKKEPTAFKLKRYKALNSFYVITADNLAQVVNEMDRSSARYSKSEATKLLLKAGIITENGDLASEYR